MTDTATRPAPATPATSSRHGALMALAAMLSVQVGVALAVDLSHDVGALGAAWLRLVWAGPIMLLVLRPRLRGLSGEAWRACVTFGVVIAGITMLFMAALTRLPMGTASALEFLGPLGVAVVRGRGPARAWALVAALGVLLLTRPWAGDVDLVGVGLALAAACCWAAYIILSQRVGDLVGGVTGLAIALPVAGLVSTLVAAPSTVEHLTWQLAVVGIGLALLVPVVPFALEMLALRRLTTAAFGTLMSVEPAIAVVIGLVVLHQVPHPLAVVGVACVVAAGIGAERYGAREMPPASTGA